MILAFLSLSVPKFNAQYQDEIWLLNGKKTLTSAEGFKKWRFSLDLDARSTFADGARARLGGLRVGLEFKRIHKFGIGIYSLDQGLSKSNTELIDESIRNIHFDFDYLTLFYERVLLFNKKWEWSAAIHFGTGNIEGTYQIHNSDETFVIDPIQVKPLELSTSAYYHFNWWLSGGGGIGYRYMRKTPQELQNDFNGAVYILKVKLRIGKLVKSIWNEDVKNEY